MKKKYGEIMNRLYDFRKLDLIMPILVKDCLELEILLSYYYKPLYSPFIHPS